MVINGTWLNLGHFPDFTKKTRLNHGSPRWIQPGHTFHECPGSASQSTCSSRAKPDGPGFIRNASLAAHALRIGDNPRSGGKRTARCPNAQRVKKPESPGIISTLVWPSTRCQQRIRMFSLSRISVSILTMSQVPRRSGSPHNPGVRELVSGKRKSFPSETRRRPARFSRLARARLSAAP